MEKNTRKTFSKEFKLEAVRMCEDRPVAEVARSLGVHDNSIYRWRQELSEDGPDAFRGNGNRTALEEENRRLRHENQQLKLEAERIAFGAKTVKGLKIITGVFPNLPADELRQMGDMLRDRDENVVAVLCAMMDGKISVLSVCGDAAIKKGIKAGDLVKHITSIAGGSGGGKPERAMGGAKNELMIDNALATIDNYVDEKVKE